MIILCVASSPEMQFAHFHNERLVTSSDRILISHVQVSKNDGQDKICKSEAFFHL